MKRSKTSSVITEMQIKAKLRHYTSTGMTNKIKQNTLTIPRAGHDMEEQLKLSDMAVKHAKQYSHYGKQFDNFLYKVCCLPYNPTIPSFFFKLIKRYHTTCKILYINVYSNFISNCLKLGITQIHIYWRTGRPINCMSV